MPTGPFLGWVAAALGGGTLGTPAIGFDGGRL